MKPKSSNRFLFVLRQFFTAQAIVISFLGTAHAANRFWDGGTANIGTNGDGASGGTAGNWNTTLTNWDQGSALAHVAWVNANNDTAVFGGTAGTVTITAPVTAGGLTFTTAGYTVAGTSPNILSLGGTTATITTSSLATSASTTLSTPIDGTLSGGLTIASNGDMSATGGGAAGRGVIFSGTNTFTANITVTSGLFSPGADATLGNAANTITLNGGGLLANTTNTISRPVAYGASNGTVRVYGSQTLTLSGLQSGAGGLTKTDSGILILSNGANTRTGTSTISAGELQALAPTAAGAYTTLGTGAITAASGTTLRFKTGSTAAAIIYANAINLNGATLIHEDGTHTLTGAIAITGNNTINGIWGGKNLNLSGIISGAGNLTKTNNASNATVVTLTGANTYTGTTTISLGTLQIGDGGATGALGTGAVTNNSILAFNRNNAFTVANVISGTGSVSNLGTGTTSLTAANTYTGGTTLAAGGLSISTATGFGTGAVNITSATGGTITVANNAATTVANNITLPAPGTAQNYNIVKNTASATTGTELNLSGVISGGGANATLFLNSSTGGDNTTTYRLSGTNTFTGSVNVNRGSVVVTNASSLGAGTNPLILNSNSSAAGNLQFAGSFTLPNPVTMLFANTIGTGTNNATLSGVLGGSANMTKVGTGTLTLSGANTLTGATIVNAGTLAITGSPTGNSAITVSNGATLALDYSTNDTGKINDAAVLTLASGSTLNLIGGTHADTVGSTSISAGTGGPATVSRTSGTAVLQLGTITAAPGAVVNFTADGIATTNNTNNANGVLGSWATVNGTDWATNSTNAANGPITAFTGYTDVPFAGTIADNSASQIRLNGGTSGDVLLGASVTNIGSLLQNQTTATVIDSATQTLRLGVSGGIFSGVGKGSLTIGNGTLTAGGGTIDTAGDLAITNSSSNTITINSAITDNGTGVVTLTKAGTGLVVLGGTNTFTGATAIGAGTLEIGGTGSLGTYNGAITNSGNLLYSSSSNSTLGGVISGSGTLAKSGSSTLSLSATNTYTGTTTINGGTLRITGTAGTLGTAAVVNNGTLDFNRSNAVAVANSISGTGSVTQTGAGTTTLSGTNTYTGGTIVSAGNLTANGGATLPTTGTTAISTGATVTLNSAVTNTYAQTFSGTGKIQLNLSGAANNTFLTGPNTGFTGVVEVIGSGSNKFTSTGLNLGSAATINVTAGNQLYVASPVPNAVSIIGTGNGETRGAIRLGSTLSGALTLLGDSTIGGEGGTISGAISGGAASAMTLTLGTANSNVGGTFSGNITNGTATSLAITAFNGTNTLSGTNTYSGATTVSGGTFNILGAQSGGGAVNVNGTSTLNLAGSVTGSTVTMAAGTTLRGEGSGSALTYSGAGNLIIDPSTAGALTTSGALTMTGATTVSFAGGAPPVSGTIRVLNFGSTTATAANFVLANAASYRSPVFTVSANAVDLTLGNTSLTWTGTGGSNWDVNTTTNWNDTTPAASKFLFGDAVTFNDTPGANQTIGLGVSVQPSSITVNNSLYNYSISGAGAIAGTTGLTKSGTANLDLGGTNTYTGNTSINGGILKMLSTTALGANTSNVSISGGGTLDLGNLTANGINLGNRIVTISGTGVGGNGAIINSGANNQQNAFVNVTLGGNATIGGTSRWDIRGAAGVLDLAGNTLTKTGANQVYVTVDGTITSGNMEVNNGILAIWNGTVQGTGNIQANTGGNLELSNMVAGKFTRQITLNGGTVSSLSTAYTSGNVVYTAPSTFSNTSQLTLAGAITQTGGPYDLVKTGAGTLVLTGTNGLTGKVNISTGILRVTSDSLLGPVPGSPVADSITLQAGGKIQGGSDVAGNDLTINSNRGITLPSGDGGFQVWAGFTMNYGGAITGVGNFTKADAGTLVYTGTSTHTGSTNLVTGTLTLTGATMNNTSLLSVQNGTLNLNTGSSITAPVMRTSDASGAVSVVNHNAGTINITGSDNSNSTAASLLLGHWNAQTTYNLSGGSLNSTNAMLSLGWDSTNTVMNQSGGTANLKGLNLNNSRNNFAAYNLTGGRLNLGSSGVTANTAKQLNLGGATLGAFADWSTAQNLSLTGTGGPITVNTLDSVDNTTGRTITLSGTLSGTGGLIKSGAGSLVLTGTKSYTGATSVNGGTLFPGATFTSSALSANAGGTIQSGTPSTSGASTVGSLALNGGNAAFRANFTTGDKFTVSTVDAFTVPTASTISVTPAGDLFVGDTLTLIDYNGTIGGLGFAGLTLAPLANPHFAASLVDDTVGTQVQVHIDSLDSIVWLGNVDGNWDVNTTSNWKTVSDDLTSNYYTYDAVKFNDDGAASPAVNLVGTIQPSSVTFDATVDYTLSGAPIIGNAGFVKTNTGKVTLLNNNTYIGTTTINNGTVAVGNGGTTGALGGTGDITIGTSATLEINRSDAQTLSRKFLGGGTLVKSGSGALTTSTAGNNANVIVNGGTFVARGGGFSTGYLVGKTITVNAGATLDTAVHSMGSSVGGGGNPPAVVLNGGNWILNGEQYMQFLTMTAATTTRVGALDGIRTLGGSVYTINAAATSSIIDSPFNLVNNVTVAVDDGAATNDLVVSGNISNAGIITKTGSGRLQITGTNTSTGGIALNGGSIEASSIADAGGVGSIGVYTAGVPGYLGIANDATFRYTGTGTQTSARNLWIDTGSQNKTIEVTSATGDITFSGTGGNINKPFTKTGPGALTLADVIQTGATVTVNGGRLSLTGVNSYTGDTTVESGTLAVNGSSIADTNKLIINSGKVEPTGTEVVDTLFFGAVQQASGTWGATGSGATHIDDVHFSGTGKVSVTTGAGFGSWITGFGLALGDQDPTDDPDFDGIANSVEFVLGGNPATGMDTALLPTIELVTTDLGAGSTDYVKFTFRRSDASAYLNPAAQYDLDLAGTWTTAVNGTAGVVVQTDDNFYASAPDGIDRVIYYIPRSLAAPGSSLFGRLNVTIP